MKTRYIAALFALQIASFVAAEDKAPQMSAEQFEASLKFQKGDVTLPNGIAALKIPSTFRYLNPTDAERVLTQAWGNPPGNANLGMLFPSDVSPLAENGWGVVITYDEDGHVEDSDADGINYDDLIKQMKEGSEEANAERKKAGYTALHLIGWAQKPHYDKTTHKFYWAEELKAEGAQQNTLNYKIRVLGRKGVLVLNAIAGMNQLKVIEGEMQKVIAFTDFTSGNTYADYDSKVDKLAAYGLTALVAGGIAAKTGLFAKLFVMILAFKKAIIFGVVALGAGAAKFFKRNKDV